MKVLFSSRNYRKRERTSLSGCAPDVIAVSDAYDPSPEN